MHCLLSARHAQRVVMKEATARDAQSRYCFVWTASVEQAATARAALNHFDLGTAPGGQV